MAANGEITIEFSEEQKTEISRKCGLVINPIVTDGLSLTMLSLAATAKNSDILPLVSRISICHQILEARKNNETDFQPFTLTLELSTEQREIIKNIVNKDWQRIVINPDDYEVNFKQVWKNQPPIQHIGQSFVIVSEKIVYTALPNQTVIKLPDVDDNNTTFGIGNHPTTQTVLLLLEKFIKPNANVLDIGTGSGILAVAAAKLGAEKVFAIDIDSNAVETAKMTVKLNNVSDKIRVKKGDIDIIEDIYDLVTANLFPKIIISLAESLAPSVSPNGVVLVSGLVSERIPEIVNVMQKAGFEHLESVTIDLWGGIAFRKKI